MGTTSANHRRLRTSASIVGLLLAVALTGCSPEVLGTAGLTRGPDGNLAALVVACEGHITQVFVNTGSRTGVEQTPKWTGDVAAPAAQVVEFGVRVDELPATARLSLYGGGTYDGFWSDKGQLWGQGPVPVQLLQNLEPDEVADWDTARHEYVAVTRDVFIKESGGC
ncbi:hypothetical protein [Microbacterium sp. ZW T5_56]|uniref:hypothetical protein n=1 Tax=Microbacterium sp. ZW T5_56 TaxID=3378081 RepID=UPI003854A7A0